ncbi:MAG: OmpA family protein [Hydrogenophaga sp.]
MPSKLRPHPTPAHGPFATSCGRATAATLVLACALVAACSGPSGPRAARAPDAGAAAPAGNLSGSLRAQLAAYERASAGTGASVSRTDDQRIRIDIPSDISFDANRSAVKPILAGLLTRYAAVARTHTDTTITIVGHTDSSGSAAANNALSRDRAQSARDYLIARGVAITRLRTESRGSSEPLADNGTPEGRAQNRRITLFIAPAGAG